MTSLRIALAVACLAASAGLIACGDDGGSSPSAVAVRDAWARSTADGQTAGAAYMKITGGSVDDRLLTAATPSDVARAVELHETVVAGGGMGSMTMRELDGLDVPAEETVQMSPGGYHVMLADLAAPLVVGRSFDLVLTFANAGPQTVRVSVRDT